MSEIPVVYYGTSGEKNNPNAFWWREPKGEVHAHVFPIVRKVRQEQNSRRADYLRFAKLYANRDFDRFISSVSASLFGKKISFNVIKACIDTACAKISTTKTRPMFLTEKGSRKQQNKAKKLTQYLDGTYYQSDIYSIGQEVFRDACIFGTGALKCLEKDNQISYERTFIDEIVVDDIDGRLGNPRQLHQTKPIHREILKEMFPDEEGASRIRQAIDSAEAVSRPEKNGLVDMIEVVESWHLPSGKDATDGRHTICIQNETLLDEEWNHESFPFIFFRWNKPILGFFGEGLAAELIGIQLEINMMLLRIKEALELMAVPRIFLEEGSNVNSSHINDEIGGIIKYRGTQPTAVTWQGMNQETYNHLEYLYKKAFEISGISQLSASSKKPAGLDSGVAIREYQDIETERFAVVASAYQKFYLDVAKLTIAIQREIAEKDPKLSVRVKEKKFMTTIKWKEVDLDDDKYIMQVFPTNFLPKTPEGKLQFVQELIQSGFIDPDWALSLLDFPDLEGFFNLKTSAIDDTLQILDRIIEDEEYTAPEVYMNLHLSMGMAQGAYLRAKTDGTSDISLEYLQRFIDDCQALLEQMNPPAPTPQPQATAVPEPKPQSDLMPVNPPNAGA